MVGDGDLYVVYGNSTRTESETPDKEKPVRHKLSKITYEEWLTPLPPGISMGGIRVLLHETGHLFGLVDYYDRMPYGDEPSFDTLGYFDMQCSDYGDWNVYSRFACGWLEPYVIDGTQREVTLKLGCSSEVPDAILIPTGGGRNGTAFDEYILVDVMAPYSGNGFDWPMLTDRIQVDPETREAIVTVRWIY